ncbi:MAG: VanZ family protein [Lachnospiraceae bacterium]|jgi:hypothetical protein|nr:VanZ family protein [Lachnospiraceae bacterium]
MWQMVSSDIWQGFRRFLPGSVAIAAFATAALYFIYRVFCRHALPVHGFRRRGPLFFLGMMYAAYVFQIAFLSREPGSRDLVDLRIFIWEKSLRSRAYVLENVLMYLPFGLFSRWVWAVRHCRPDPRHLPPVTPPSSLGSATGPAHDAPPAQATSGLVRRPSQAVWVVCGILPCIVAALLSSLCIEVAQLVTKRGYFQVNDIVMNTCGAILGWAIGAIMTIIMRIVIKIFSCTP